jgi:predicted porin
MNKPFALSLLAAAAACCAVSAHAQTGPGVTVYGVADAAAEASNSGRGTNYRVVSGGNLGSRLGFRGVEDLGNGLSAVFRLEMGMNIDDGNLGQGGRAWGREASVGLQSAQWGTAVLGRVPTPYYVVHSNVDAFAWMGSGGLPAISRSEAANRPLLPLQIAARMDNALGYATPSFGGFEFRVLGSLGEGSANIGRGYGASGRYAQGPITAVVGYTRQNGANNAGASGNARAAVVGGSFDFGVARLFAGVTDERNSCTTACPGLTRVTGSSTTDFRLLNLGVRAPFGALTAIAQVTRVNDRSTYTAATPDRDANWYAIGAEYSFSKRSMLYGSVGTIDNKNGSSYVLGSGTAQQPTGAIGTNNPRATTAQIGIRHVF